MKKLEKMGLVPLTKKETTEENGGGVENEKQIPDIKDMIKVCCINIPLMPVLNM